MYMLSDITYIRGLWNAVRILVHAFVLPLSLDRAMVSSSGLCSPISSVGLPLLGAWSMQASDGFRRADIYYYSITTV